MLRPFMGARCQGLVVWTFLTLASGCGRAPVEGSWDNGYLPPSDWVRIPAGSFTMGSPASEPCRGPNETERRITLSRALLVWPTEVTQSQFYRLMGYNPSTFGPAGIQGGCATAACPVEEVTWHQAASYCNARSDEAALPRCYTCTGAEGKTSCVEAASHQKRTFPGCPGYRLPTEAEWEYTYRAGTTTSLYNGTPTTCGAASPQADAIAWNRHNANMKTHPVATKAPNAWGLYDMAGNLWECNHDGKHDEPPKESIDPVGVAEGTLKVVRGGSWSESWEYGRGAQGTGFRAEARGNYVGFRCVRALP